MCMCVSIACMLLYIMQRVLMLYGLWRALNDDCITTLSHNVQIGWLLGSICSAVGLSIYVC